MIKNVNLKEIIKSLIIIQIWKLIWQIIIHLWLCGSKWSLTRPLEWTFNLCWPDLYHWKHWLMMDRMWFDVPVHFLNELSLVFSFFFFDIHLWPSQETWLHSSTMLIFDRNLKLYLPHLPSFFVKMPQYMIHLFTRLPISLKNQYEQQHSAYVTSVQVQY